MLYFDQTQHRYYLDGEELRSTTRFLEDAGLKAYAMYSPGAAERGKEIHALTEAVDSGIAEPGDFIDHDYYGYLRGWEAFKAATNVRMLEIEKIVGNGQLKLAGTIDRIARIGGDVITIDIKSGAKASWHKYQLATYNLITETMRKRVCVYLSRDGGFKVEEYADSGDYLVIRQKLVMLRLVA